MGVNNHRVNTDWGKDLVPLGNKPFTWTIVDDDLSPYGVAMGQWGNFGKTVN